MNEIETLTKLDILLKILQSEKDAIDFNSIKSKESSFEGKWLKMALYKLEHDGYAYELVNGDETVRI